MKSKTTYILLTKLARYYRNIAPLSTHTCVYDPFELPSKYDLITAFDAIHDQPNPYLVFRSIYNSLDDKGIFLMQDTLASTPLKDNIAHPL